MQPTTPSTEETGADECPVRVGEVVSGKYRMDRIVGVGGMAVVIAAMHLELEQPVAVKILLPRNARDPEAIARFVREARASVRLKSAHAVHVLDVGSLASGPPFMVMELLEGEDLGAVLDARGQALPVPEALDYVLQACDAVSEAHALGIVHRDIKPENLFLARTWDATIVKVLDFGISKVNTESSARPQPGGRSLTQETTIIGSPRYMSPEQVRSSRDVDARSDVWSLGVVLYELLTFQSPFTAETPADIFVKVLDRAPQPIDALVPTLPPGLAAVVMRCLEKDRDRRFESVDALAAALQVFATPTAGHRPRYPTGSDLGQAAANRMRSAAAFAPMVTSSSQGPTRSSAARIAPWLLVGMLTVTIVAVGAVMFAKRSAVLSKSESVEEPRGPAPDPALTASAEPQPVVAPEVPSAAASVVTAPSAPPAPLPRAGVAPQGRPAGAPAAGRGTAPAAAGSRHLRTDW